MVLSFWWLRWQRGDTSIPAKCVRLPPSNRTEGRRRRPAVSRSLRRCLAREPSSFPSGALYDALKHVPAHERPRSARVLDRTLPVRFARRTGRQAKATLPSTAVVASAGRLAVAPRAFLPGRKSRPRFRKLSWGGAPMRSGGASAGSRLLGYVMIHFSAAGAPNPRSPLRRPPLGRFAARAPPWRLFYAKGAPGIPFAPTASPKTGLRSTSQYAALPKPEIPATLVVRTSYVQQRPQGDT